MEFSLSCSNSSRYFRPTKIGPWTVHRPPCVVVPGNVYFSRFPPLRRVNRCLTRRLPITINDFRRTAVALWLSRISLQRKIVTSYDCQSFFSRCNRVTLRRPSRENWFDVARRVADGGPPAFVYAYFRSCRDARTSPLWWLRPPFRSRRTRQQVVRLCGLTNYILWLVNLLKLMYFRVFVDVIICAVNI